MAMTEKLRFLLEADASGAVRGFQQVGAAADKNLIGAQSRIDKFKGGLPHLSRGMIAVGAAAGTGLFKAADAFQDLALEAGKFSDATGVAVSDASRWIEVAGDMGVESGALETALNKLNKTIDATPEKLAAFGVNVRRAGDGTVDVNATFLALVDRLNAIPDAAQRARVASELLGKGWQSMAELIATGSGELKRSLAEVSDAKVIDPEEVKRAKEYRESMDKFKDSMQDLGLILGESVVPMLGEMAEAAGDAIETLGPLLGALGEFQAWVKSSRTSDNPFESITGAFLDSPLGNLKRINAEMEKAFPKDSGVRSGGARAVQLEHIKANAIDAVDAVNTFSEAWAAMNAEGEAAERAAVAMKRADDAARAQGEAMGHLAVKAHDAADAEQRAAKGVRDYESAWDSLTGKLDDSNSWLDVQDTFADLEQQAKDSAKAMAKGGEEGEQAMRDQGRAINDTKIKVAEYAKEVLGLPPDAVTKIVAEVDDGDLDALLRKLAILTRNKGISMQIQAGGGAGYSPDQQFADGGVVQGPKGSPQVVLAHAGETILPTHKPGGDGMGGVNNYFTINAGLSSPRDTAKAIAEMLTKYGYR